MTWKQIKDSIESQGVDDDTEISWMEINGSNPIVEFTADGTVEIC